MRIVYNEFTKEINFFTIEDTADVIALPPGYSIIQGSPNTCYLQAIAVGIDTSEIPGMYVLDDRAKLIARLNRCKNCKLRFLEENLSATIDPARSAQLLQTFINVMLLLDAGDAKTALGAVMQIPGSYFPVTKIHGSTSLYEDGDARKESYVIELQKIVTDLFE
jgi:hypothetical protein